MLMGSALVWWHLNVNGVGAVSVFGALGEVKPELKTTISVNPKPGGFTDESPPSIHFR